MTDTYGTCDKIRQSSVSRCRRDADPRLVSEYFLLAKDGPTSLEFRFRNFASKDLHTGVRNRQLSVEYSQGRELQTEDKDFSLFL